MRIIQVVVVMDLNKISFSMPLKSDLDKVEEPLGFSLFLSIVFIVAKPGLLQFKNMDTSMHTCGHPLSFQAQEPLLNIFLGLLDTLGGTDILKVEI